MTHMRHPNLDRVIEVPDSAVPIYRQSGWDVLTEQETAALERKRLQDAQAAEAAMAAAARPERPAPRSEPPAAQPDAEPAPRKSGSKSKENS